MKPNREGPFFITEVLGLVTYRLQLLATWRIHDVFHATLLQPYKENGIYGENFVKPPPELEEGKEVYNVETILNHRKRGSFKNHEPPSNPSSYNISIHDSLFDQSEDQVSNPRTTNMGSRRNLIYVLNDDEVQCEGCWEEGHFIGDCN